MGRRMTADEWLDKTWGLTRAQVAEQLGVHRSTVHRWIRGEVPVPGPVLAYFAATAGDLEHLGGPDWRGWRLDRAGLHAPWHRRPFRPEEIWEIPALHARLAQLKAQPQLELFA